MTITNSDTGPGGAAHADDLPGNLEECHQLIKDLRTALTEANRQLEKKKKRLFEKHSANVPADTLTDEAREMHEQMTKDLESELAKLGKTPKSKSKKKHGGGGKNAPKHAPKQRSVEHRIDDPSRRLCACCGAQTKIKGFKVQSKLEVLKALFEEIKHIIFTYECPKCGEETSADPPEELFENSYATPSLVAHIGVSKFDRLEPTYRQEKIYRNLGMPLGRSTMGRLLQKGARELEPIVKRMRELLLKCRVVQADPTKMPLIVKGKGKVHQGQFWQYRSDDFPYVFYDFTKSGGAEHPARILKGFKNILQTDGAPVFNEVIRGGATQANCLAHAYRYWEDAKKSDPVRADYAISLFKALYDIEREIVDWSEQERKDLRQRLSVPKLEKLKSYFDKLAQDPTVTPKSAIGEAVEYCLNRWDALCLYTEHGFMRPDTNPTEAGHRKVAQGRNSWLFAGSVEGGETAAIWMTLIQTCNRLDIDPFDYIVDLLSHLPSSPQSQLDRFLPDQWKAERMKEDDRKVS
jgi:transposase